LIWTKKIQDVKLDLNLKKSIMLIIGS
jgi:hypothetical protein